MINDYANKLEGILRNYLKCNFGDFGVKANYNLISCDWKSPINFALGHKYAMSNNSIGMKKEINIFFDDHFKGKNMNDLIKNYEFYGFKSKNEVYTHIDNSIKALSKILDE